MTKTDPPTLNTSARLAEQIASIDVHLIRELWKELYTQKISLTRYYLLSFVAGEKRLLAMNEISKKMRHSKTATTEHIEELVKKGYVRRLQPKDRRKLLIEITDKGGKFMRKIHDFMAQKLSQLIAPLNEKEESQLLIAYENLLEGATRTSIQKPAKPELLEVK